jgi:hypothetical protein
MFPRSTRKYQATRICSAASLRADTGECEPSKPLPSEFFPGLKYLFRLITFLKRARNARAIIASRKRFAGGAGLALQEPAQAVLKDGRWRLFFGAETDRPTDREAAS